MADYKDEIVAKARELRSKHRAAHFTPRLVHRGNLRKIAERFTNHRLTNVETIKTLKKTIQYMVAAKMVGDRKLFEALSNYTDGLLDSYCENINIEDDCNDEFNSAVERHLYRVNEEVFELLKTNKIRYIDAGLVKYNGTDIFIPAFDERVCVVGNRRCIDEINSLIKRNSKDKKADGDEFAWQQKNITSFVVVDGALRVNDKDVDNVKLDNGVYVNEYIIDEETDPDKLNMRMFDTSTSRKGTIRTFRRVPTNKLQDGDEILVQNGIVYYDEKNRAYRIVGQYTLMKLDRYADLNRMSIIYSYTGDKGVQLVDVINLGNLNKQNVAQKYKDWAYNNGDVQLNGDMLYLFKGSTQVGEIKYRETVTFENIKEMLDSFS